MSLINQVISQLDQRGAETAHEMELVRPVNRGRQSPVRLFYILLALVALALLLAALVWKWQKGNALSPVSSKSMPILQPVLSQPASAAMLVASAPESAPALSAASAVKEAAPAIVAGASPVFQLSFELGKVALAEPRVETGKPQRVTAKPRATAAQPKQQAVPAVASAPVATESNAVPLKQISPKQQAEAEFRKGIMLMQQGRIDDALAEYRAALNLDASHDQARQALVLLLIENKRSTEAEQVLQDAVISRPEKLRFVMMQARLQVERGAINDAVATLERSAHFAAQQPDYQAFYAALLQRQERHKEAVEHYQVALRQTPDNGLWWMGEGISLQALQRKAEAKDAYMRALNTQTLRPDLQAFVQQKLKEL